MKELQKTKPKVVKVYIIRVKDNAKFIAESIIKASNIAGVSVSTIKQNLNADKVINGYKFYDYRYYSLYYV